MKHDNLCTKIEIIATPYTHKKSKRDYHDSRVIQYHREEVLEYLKQKYPEDFL